MKKSFIETFTRNPKSFTSTRRTTLQGRHNSKRRWAAIAADNNMVEQMFYWFTGLGPGTLIGVVSMPMEYLHDSSEHAYERHCVLAMYRDQLWNCEIFDCNVGFGPSGFKEPDLATGQSEGTTIVYRASGCEAKWSRNM